MAKPSFLITAKRLCRNQGGVVLIEMVVVLPILLMLVFGVISFGYVFVVYEDLGMVVSSAGSAIQNDPANPTTTRAFALSAGQPWITFSGTNTICAQSFAQGAALPNPYCTGTTWNTAAPGGVTAGTPYVVAIQASYSPKLALPNTYTWLVGQTFTQKTTVTVAGSPNYPTCPSGQYLTSSNGTSLTCSTPASSAGPSGSWCGNDVIVPCAVGAGGGNPTTPNVSQLACVVGGTSYYPATSCPSGYTQYMYNQNTIKSSQANCWYTCVKN